jgi:hypothetical protein
MISVAVDPDQTTPWSAGRLHFAMHPGQRAALASEEGAGVVLVCGTGALTIEVTGDARGRDLRQRIGPTNSLLA